MTDKAIEEKVKKIVGNEKGLEAAKKIADYYARKSKYNNYPPQRDVESLLKQKTLNCTDWTDEKVEK